MNLDRKWNDKKFAKEWEKKYFKQSDLLKRGWTKENIKKYTGNSDYTGISKDSKYYYPYYLKKRVLEIEACLKRSSFN